MGDSMSDGRRTTDRLDAAQRALWDEMQFHDAGQQHPGQTRRQAINLKVLTFLFWDDFAGVGPADPTPTAIEAEFERHGVPEDAPGEDFWRLLTEQPGYPWILAPGARREAWREDVFGRPTVYVLQFDPPDDTPEPPAPTPNPQPGARSKRRRFSSGGLTALFGLAPESEASDFA
jgi:hypothetical protein